MARYYFDIDDGMDFRDEVGRELDDITQARREALQVATRLLAEEAADSRETVLVLTVREQSGRTPLTIRLVSQIEEA